MFVKTFAGAVVGIDAVTVTVEVNIAGGGLGLYLVGLPDNAVKESEQRIRAAFENSGEHMSGKKVVVNLAPADLRKEGAAFDLPIAVGILAAMGRIETGALADTLFAGELSLDGSVKPVRGILPVAIQARHDGVKRLVVPAANAAEAAVVEGVEVFGAGSLKEVAAFLNGEAEIAPAVAAADKTAVAEAGRYDEDFADVKGQAHVKRALEIAAAGGHNVLMIGSPGSGKTMLARRMPTILPPLSSEEALETTKIHSVAGLAGSEGLLSRRPFRSPHHTVSQVALIGGGQSPHPGEVSLAHNGVLFLDELPEFGRSALEVLRQPLEEKRITVARARYRVLYPANFTLVAAMNPCPCGYYNHPSKECSCSSGAVQRYMAGFGPADGPHRHARRGDARRSVRTGRRRAGRTEQRHSRTGVPGAGGAARTLPRLCGGAYQRHDERGDAARILPAGRRVVGAAGTGHAAAVALGPCLRPDSESGAHDCRPGGTRTDRSGRRGRSDQLPFARPRELGTMKIKN